MRGRNMPRMPFKLHASKPRTLQGNALLTYTDLIWHCIVNGQGTIKISIMPSILLFLKNVVPCSYTFCFIFNIQLGLFLWSSSQVGSYFPDRGLNLHRLYWKHWSLNHWATREVPHSSLTNPSSPQPAKGNSDPTSPMSLSLATVSHPGGISFLRNLFSLSITITESSIPLVRFLLRAEPRITETL